MITCRKHASCDSTFTGIRTNEFGVIGSNINIDVSMNTVNQIQLSAQV